MYGIQVAQKEGQDKAKRLKKGHKSIKTMYDILCSCVFQLKNFKQGNNVVRFTF